MARIASALVALTALAAGCGSSSSPDRAGLTFTRYTSPEDSSVWAGQADGSHPWKIADHAYQGTLSPDGRSVAYYEPQKGFNGFPTLFIRGLGGGEARSIGKADDYAWSPDSKHLAVSTRNSLFLVDARSGHRRVLARGDVWGASFAPGGAQLAYVRANRKAGHEYRGDIFVVRLSDGEATQATHDGHSDTPVWGRDWIAYRNFYFNAEWSMGRLWLMRPDGSGKRMLARGDERVSHAAMGLDPIEFSVDGKQLLACAAFEFSCPPVVFGVPDSKKYPLRIRHLVHTQEAAYSRDLAEDGTRLLVDVGPFDGDQGHRVYLVPVGGGKPRLLLHDGNDASWAH